MNDFLKQLEDSRALRQAAEHKAAEEWKALSRAWGEIQAAMHGPLSLPSFQSAAKQIAATVRNGRAESLTDLWSSSTVPGDRARLSLLRAMFFSAASDIPEHIEQALELWPDIEGTVQGLRHQLESDEDR